MGVSLLTIDTGWDTDRWEGSTVPPEVLVVFAKLVSVTNFLLFTLTLPLSSSPSSLRQGGRTARFSSESLGAETTVTARTEFSPCAKLVTVQF